MPPRYEFSNNPPPPSPDAPIHSSAFRRPRSKSTTTSHLPIMHSFSLPQITQSGLGSSVELYHRTIPFDAILGGGTYITCDRCRIGTHT